MCSPVNRKTSMQTLAIEPQCKSCWFHAICPGTNESQKDGPRAMLCPLPEMQALNREISWMNWGTLQWPICTDPWATTNNTATWQSVFCVFNCMVKMRPFFIFRLCLYTIWSTMKGYPHCINCLCCSVAQQSAHWESPEMQANTESLCLLSGELGRVQ